MFVNRMNATSESIEQTMESSSIRFTKIPWIVTNILAIIIVFVFPYGYAIDLGPGPNLCLAISWEYQESGILLFFTALEYFPYYLYRFVVLYSIWKYSLGREKTRKLVIHASICVSISVLLSIPAALFLSPSGEGYLPIMIPLPFLLLYCILLAFYGKHLNLK